MSRRDDTSLSADERALVDELRAARPEPAREPDWDDMAAGIAAACAEVDATRTPSLASRLRAFLAPRYLILAAGAAALALGWLALRDDRPAPPEVARVEPAPIEPAPIEPAPIEPAPIEPAPIEPPSTAALAELDESELDALASALDDGGWNERLADPVASPPLDPIETVGAADLAGASGSDLDQVTGFGLGVFEAPDYGDWVDDLDESELDALDAYLDEILAG